ncbi:hypothetical protein [Sorangium sp. So ce128]|uniref:hypothetical protein n=1 Tax=Sorangium sp. So ce128 TaxID=3133281 RepID=UPI003F5E14D8
MMAARLQPNSSGPPPSSEMRAPAPFYERMRARGRRPAVAAAIAVGLSSIVIVAVLAGISSLLVGRGVVLAGALIAALSPGAPARELVVE